MKQLIAALAGLAGTAFVPALAIADEAASLPDISGDWTFVANVDPVCTFSGTALLTKTDDPTRYGCELTAIQVCDAETWQVRQSCQATTIGDELVISSQIEEFVQGEQTGAYRPDNFKLKIKSADHMRGVLISWGAHIAEFRRSDGAMS